MKKYTHAWISLKALEYLKSCRIGVSGAIGESSNRLTSFLDTYTETFVRGSWFPDNVICDNLQGGHTWKYKFDPAGRIEKRKPPEQMLICRKTENLQEAVKPALLDSRSGNLADRCEALSLSIRDSIKITNKVRKGDIVAWNDSQIALQFCMLSHYIADATMPLHCDRRDFNEPSKIHADIEVYWEALIKKHYFINAKKERFDLDGNNVLRIRENAKYLKSELKVLDDLLDTTGALDSTPHGSDWQVYLGRGNNNIWDFTVAVAYSSYLYSRYILLPETDKFDYFSKAFRIMNEPVYCNRIVNDSPEILFDSIIAVAVSWLTTWLRWELIK